MSTIEKHVDIAVPSHVAYAQWTQFEDMPRYLDHVAEVEQIDDRHLRWTVRVGGETRVWDAEITEQIPDKRIAWTGRGDVRNAGCVTFHRLSDDSCRVMLQMDVEPSSVAAKAADLLKLVELGVAAELGNFKAFIEERREPTGRWPGSIPAPDEQR